MSENIVLFSNLDDQVRYQPIPWTPAKITTALWLDAADASTITEETGVSVWADKSGNSRDVAQVTPAKQPIYNSTTKKVEFDFKYMSASFGLTLTQPNTIISVCKFDAPASAYVFFDGIDSTNRNLVSTTAGDFLWNAGISQTGAPAVANEGILYATFNGAASEFRLGGGAATVADVGTKGLAGLVLGAVFNFAIGWDGEVAEYIILNSVPDTATRQKIEGYLAWKWDAINGNTNLVTALPAGHPYKTFAPLP